MGDSNTMDNVTVYLSWLFVIYVAILSSSMRDIWQLVIRNSDPEFKDCILMLSRNAPYIFVFKGGGRGSEGPVSFGIISYNYCCTLRLINKDAFDVMRGK